MMASVTTSNPPPTLQDGALDVDGANAEVSECQRLLKLLRRITTNVDAPAAATTVPNRHLLTDEDAAALLSYLAKLRDCCCCDNADANAAMEWNEANVELVRLTVKATIQSLNDSSFSIMDGKMARRLLTDGVLPFASTAVPMPSSTPFSSFGTSFHNMGQPLVAARSSATATEKIISPCIWIAKLIKSIVIEDLLPIALMPLRPNCGQEKNEGRNNDSRTNTSNSNRNERSNITTALGILLSTFLTRMDTDESAQLLSPPTPSSSTDAILDRLCCGIAIQTSNDSAPLPTGIHTECLRPSAATSVIAALREFETSNETSTLLGGRSGTGLGRLSRRRVWTLQPTRENTTTQPQELVKRYDVHYVYVDRPTSLLIAGLSSLQSLATTKDDDEGRNDDYDLDALPPLVYQLSLLPMSMTSISSSVLVGSGGGKTESGDSGKVGFTQPESDKQRGVRLRRMCLEGIAHVLEEDVCCLRDQHPPNRQMIKTDDAEVSPIVMKKKSRYQEAHQWARYTSLSHLGNSFRSDPMLSKAMLSLLSGEILRGVTTGGVASPWHQSQEQRPFRYARLTPFKLAMGLSMASSVPRMRASILGAVCDLVLEEEMLRSRCGLAAVDPFEEDASSSNGTLVNRTSDSSRRQPWMNCLVRSLEMECTKNNDQNVRKANDGLDKGLSHVLHCLLLVAKFAENEHCSNSFGMGGGGEALIGGSGGCSSSLLQSLHQLGFLLIDCVKKDAPSKNEASRNKLQAMQSIAVLAPNLDISSFSGNNVAYVSATTSVSAPHAAAAVGRFLLCFLFYQSSLSSISSRSFSMTSSQSGLGETALCRSIIRSSFERFCGNAPNALEHALLIKDLLRFRPTSVAEYSNDRESVVENDLGWTMSEENDQQMIIALALISNYLPSIIDSLSSIPGGGMSPTVASQVIVPTLGSLLLLMAAPSQRGFAGSLWKRHELEDSVNQTFLFAKKCLYAADVEKRKCAANMLAMLLGVASVAASVSRNGGVAAKSRGNKTSSIWSTILQDIKTCLRRSLTQHQGEVRMEVYSSLVALLPASAPCSGPSANKNLSATQDATSPATSSASGSRGNRTPPPNMSSFKNIFDSIPPIGQHATISVVSELLLSSLERYITIPKEERIDREARRARAAQGVGLSQMEMIIEEESEITRPDEQSNPFRFEKCISTCLANSSESDEMKRTEGNGKKDKSKIPPGQSLFTEAFDRINEPLSYLIASCIAVISLTSGETNDCNESEKYDELNTENLNPSNSELHNAINRIRQQFVRCTDIQQHLQWIKTNKNVFDIQDNIKRAKEMAINKLATLMLVSLAADVLINSCDLKDVKGLNSNAVVVMEARSGFSDVADDIEDLFSLRTKAIEEAAAIMSSFVVKPTRAKSSAKSNSKRKKALKDVNANSSSQSSELHAIETRSEKSLELTKLNSSDISKATLSKNRKFIENMLGNSCPAHNQDFLAESLRKFGSSSKKLLDDADSDHNADYGNKTEGSAHARLSKCLAFRRFIITKSLLLMSGTSSIVKAGSSFEPFSLVSGGASHKSKIHIAASLLLGPLLFVEFCSHCYDLDQTSIESSKLSLSSDLSLAQLSLRAFTSCVRGMMIDTGHHPLSKAARVNVLLMSAIRKVCIAVPSSVDGWEFFKTSESNFTHNTNRVPADDVALAKTLLPILSPATLSSCVSTPQGVLHLCLFSELLSNCMYGEASECCYFISSVAEAFEEANSMEQQGVYLLRAFELGQHAHSIGVLGIDHSDASNECNSCVSAAISVAMKLNCGLDGNTSVPLPIIPDASQDGLRLARSKMGLSMTKVENWPENHRDRLKREATTDNGMIGIASQLAWAILAAHDNDKHFIATFDKNAQTRKQLKLQVVKSVTQISDANSLREKASIAQTISSAIDVAIENAEFVALKLIPHMLGSVDLAQRFVSELLFSCSKMISLSAPSANFLRVDGSFASTLLKCTKRMYGVLTKLILSFVNSPQALASNETKNFLDYLVGTLMRRVSALLLSLQEKQETAGGKLLAECKIESHGKIAASLVFEKEKLDNSLLRVGAKLKQSGLKRESEWLENHIVANLNPDFSIKRVAEAKKREAPALKKKALAGSKRKAVLSTKNKPAMFDEESDINSDDENDDSIIESVDADDSMDDGDDVISLSKLTADMDEDQNSDEDSDESEAEFE